MRRESGNFPVLFCFIEIPKELPMKCRDAHSHEDEESRKRLCSARECASAHSFVSEKENALLVTGTVNSKENSKREKFSSEYDFPRGKSCVIL